MSCLTSILQLLQVLTTLTGCNIYRYVEDRQVFRLNPKINFLVGAMHRFWFRPWLLMIFLMYSICWVMEFLMGEADLTPGSERPLHLLYWIGLTIGSCQNFIISVGVAYHYRYHRKLMRQVLNGFVRIYFGYERVCGRPPRINWWIFIIQAYRIFIASSIPVKTTSAVVLGFGSKIDVHLRRFGFMFICVQPFLLSFAVHLGVLILYACYDIQEQSKQSRKSFRLYAFYKALIKLRLKFDLLIRPFVWTALLEVIILFIGYFHLILYDQQSLKRLVMTLIPSLAFPLSFLHITAGIRAAEKEFGEFKANFGPQRQTQMLWLYKLVISETADRSEINVFRLDRGFILEILRLGWVVAMFSNS